MKKAKAMYIPAGGKKAVWGPVDHNVLPEGYPYKEQSEKVVVEETAVEMTATGETGIYQGRCVTELYWKDGENCILKLDGESYECTVKNISGTMYIGNIWLMGKAMGESDENLALMGFENTGERFLVYNTPDGDFAIMLNTAVETVTFGLSQKSETIHTMAPEFLPAGVGGGKVRYYFTEQSTLVNADNVLIPYEQAKKDFENVVISPYGYDSMVLIPAVIQDNGDSVSFIVYVPGQNWSTLTTGERV